MLLALKVPPDNQRGPRFMQEAFAAIHQSKFSRSFRLSFEFGFDHGWVGLCCRVPDAIGPLVTRIIGAKFPDCEFTLHQDRDVGGPCDHSCTAELCLTPDLFPILRHNQFEDMAGKAAFADPIDAILRTVQPDDRVHARAAIEIVPTSRKRHWWARLAVAKLDHPYFRSHDTAATLFARMVMHPTLWPVAALWGLRYSGSDRHRTAPLDTSSGRHHEREDDVQAAGDKVGGHLFDARIRLTAFAPKEQRHLAEQRLREMAGAFGSFTVSRLATFRLVRRKTRRTFLLSHEELATLWHPPTASVHLAHLDATEYRELEAPPMFNAREEEGVVVGTPLGDAKHRGNFVSVHIAPEDRRRHLYIVGKTGMGKTTLLEHLITSDMHHGRGVCLIDPHGDLADRVLAFTPRQRTNDVVLFDPNDPEYAVAFNPLACSDPEKRDLVADDVLSAISKVYDLSQTPRLRDTLRNALYVLVEKQLTLFHLLLLLADEQFRRQVLIGIDDEVARLFWQSEFPSWNKTYRTEALSAVQNKIRPFLMNKRVRAIVGQRGRPLDLRRIMDEQKILIVNLSKGKLGEDNASLLGSLLVSSIQQAAMSRADVPELERPDFYLYVDEFQNFTTGSFATILSEARKFRLNLIVAHQYLRQLDRERSDAVFGNVGSLVAFQVGSEDTETLAQQLAKHQGQLTPSDLANLPKYRAYARILHDGMPVGPFTLHTLPPVPLDDDRAETVRRMSRRQFAQPAAVVRSQLSEELGVRLQERQPAVAA